MASNLHIKRICVGMLQTNCFIAFLEDSTACVVVDPGDDADRIRRAMGERHLAAILLTHGHFDHMGAVAALMTPDTALVIHETDAPMLSDPTLNVSWMINQHITAPHATLLVHEGDTFSAAGLTFTVLHTPGHTAGSVCYACDDVLFTGDTLMGVGCGRTDLPTGNDEDMEHSLQRLYSIAGQYRCLGGHGPCSA